MRYPASEKLEIIRLVEGSHLPVNRTPEKLGVSRPTFHRWCDLYQRFGEDGLEDRRSGPGRVWNRIPDEVRGQLIDLALEQPELSPRELAVTFTDERAYFVSEASVYRLLRAHGLITSPAFAVMKAADEFHHKTTAPNQLWQTELATPPCGSPISRSLAGAGSISPPSSMTSRATSSPGSSAPRCGRAM
jgi:putative transposase